MAPSRPSPPPAATAFQVLVDAVQESGVPFVLHEHEPTRTVEDAARRLTFDVTRIVKTVVFRARGGRVLLVAVRGVRRVDYARLAAFAGVNRRELASVSPDEVRELLGVEPGSVSPIPLRPDAPIFVDHDVLSVLPTLYCGIGRSDRTLEIAPADLVRLSGGRVGTLSCGAADEGDDGSRG